MSRILALLVDRANYGRMRPVLQELRNRPEIDLGIMVSGTMPLERFGSADRLVESDGFRIDSRIYMEIEGGLPISMAKSLGHSIVEYTTELHRLKPDFLLLIGDRYEALGAAMAAAYLNICVIHLQGGEVSGSIDESARHAITKFSHYHFPATARSAEYLVRMGEDPAKVFNFGCPSVDVAALAPEKLPESVFKSGVGAPIDPSNPYFLVLYHSVTTDFERSAQVVGSLLKVLEERAQPTVWLWPNIDAGTDLISKQLRTFRETHRNTWLRLFKNFPPEIYLSVLRNAQCAIGNSSSFVRDSGFLGTPVLLLGERQIGREYAENVMPCREDEVSIRNGIEKSLSRGKLPPVKLYGEKGASRKIAEKIVELTPYHKKLLHYVVENS